MNKEGVGGVCVCVCVCVRVYIYTHSTHIHYRMERYSAIKKSEIIPFTVTRMDLEIIILSEASQTEKHKYHYITYMRSLKNGVGELIYKTDIDSQTEKTNLELPKGNGRRIS